MGARGALSTRERALLATDVRAALGELEESGTALDALAVHPWLSTVPAAVLLREAVRLAPSSSLRTLALSERMEQRLERAVALFDRIGPPGAGATELLALAWGMTGRQRRVPFSLGGYAVLLRLRSRRRRRSRGARKPGIADRELERLAAKGLA